MALEKHIESLKRQHARLDMMLRAEEASPGADRAAVLRLKSEKLAIKDKIEQLLHGERVAA